MKKDLYALIAIVILVVAAAATALFFYNRHQQQAEFKATESETGSFHEARVDLNLLMGSGSVALGPPMARIVLVEFLDPECESCRAMHPYTKAVLNDYQGKIHYVLRYMPFHANSVYAASLLEATRKQDKFWEALDLVFERQGEWADHQAPKPEQLLKILASLKLNMTKLQADAKDPELPGRIERDKQDGIRAGVTGTPTFFVNGRLLRELGDAPLRALIEEELRLGQ